MQQWQKYLAEVLGTFVLVLIGTMGIVAAGRLGDPVAVVVPLAFGLALLAGLYALRGGVRRPLQSGRYAGHVRGSASIHL